MPAHINNFETGIWKFKKEKKVVWVVAAVNKERVSL